MAQRDADDQDRTGTSSPIGAASDDPPAGPAIYGPVLDQFDDRTSDDAGIDHPFRPHRDDEFPAGPRA